jgi:exodeoxyribonuclease VII small subunit
MTYHDAFNALEKLVEQIEDDKIQLDTLAGKVKEANTLIAFCEEKLRGIERDVDEVMKK